LVVALVLSLAAHLALVPIVGRPRPPEPIRTPEVVSMHKHRIVVVPTPPPTPPPTPTPKPTPRPTPKPTPRPTQRPTPKPRPTRRPLPVVHHPKPKPKPALKLRVHPPKATAHAKHAKTEHKYKVEAGSEKGVPSGKRTTGEPSGLARPVPTPRAPVPTPRRAERPAPPPTRHPDADPDATTDADADSQAGLRTAKCTRAHDARRAADVSGDRAGAGGDRHDGLADRALRSRLDRVDVGRAECGKCGARRGGKPRRAGE